MRAEPRRIRRHRWPRTIAAVVAAVATVLVAPAARAAAGPTVLVDEAFNAQTTPANFGFPTGAAVAGGVLNVTKGMGSYTTSVKTFDATVVQQSTLDLAFDWRTAVASSGMKTGLELRDTQGNLVFAIAGTATELRYGVTGPASESTSAPDALNPARTRIAFDRNKRYTVNLHLDFTLHTVQYTIATKETAATVMTSGTATMTGTSLAKLVACDCYGTGVQSVDNVRLTAPGNPANGRLNGKTVYAFGDSIVYGHKYSRGFVNFTAERERMTLTKYARNGATIGPGGYSGGQVLTQVQGAATRAPDYVVFDGGTNDVEAIHDKQLYAIGAMADGFDPARFDRFTYAGSLETVLSTMRTKWPATRIVYVAVHRLGSRDWNTQLALRALTLQVCAKWGVTVADVFNDSTLDTRVDGQRVTYTFNDLVNGYPGTGGSGTHPNIAAITAFYAPVPTAALAQP
ncbi:SGNH/GDSL hydrolase family protein [Dactylosporangium sp. NPDC051541]|uniref:SGNH/GDSL hydrolase family protein n=1 Tax=Dactylosporangium sp. NPDC051541 TaxID=3363977 RepID=UPI0037A19DF2